MDTPNATWHPAMMPNTHRPKQQASDPDPSPNQPVLPSSEQSFEHPPKDVSDAEVPQHAPQPQDSSDGAFLGQFDGEEDAAGDVAWDLSNPSHPSSALAEQGGDDHAFASRDEPDTFEPKSAPTSRAAKHSSTISFTRTVSHDVSFSDGDDSEWNLQRADTDPFNFMPPSERSNSFPVVPQREDATEDQMDHPPPSSQARDILEDLGRDEFHADAVAQSDFPGALGDDQDVNAGVAIGSFSQQYLGGDLVGAEEDESDARFEEGLPLIPHDEALDSGDNRAHQASDLGDAFARDDAAEGGDDFFSQINNESSQLGSDGFDRALHRKSTTMVISEAMHATTGENHSDSEVPTPTEAPGAVSDEVYSVSKEETGGTDTQPESSDLDAKWAAAFDDDDDFLVDSTAETKELDPADIFGSDDEGFLEETPEETVTAPAPQPNASVNATAQPPGVNGHYVPDALQRSTLPSTNHYAPAPTVPQVQPPHPTYIQPATAPPPVTGGYGAPPQPAAPKAQSFADKSKGGYTSPYDLPMEVVKPKKRISMQQLPRSTTATPLAPPPGPPRSASMYSQVPPPPSGGSNASASPPPSSHSNQHPPPTGHQSTPPLKSKPSFFEDLPIASKPRAAVRHGGLPSPPQQSPYGQPQGPPHGPPRGSPHGSPHGSPYGPPHGSPYGPPVTSAVAPPPLSHPPQENAAGIAPLVPPERVSPYTALQSNSQPRPSALGVSNTRYSPAPAQLAVSNGGGHPPPASSRYSPAPPLVRSSSTGYAAVPSPALAHQPRTSSPLAHSHFEISHERPVAGATNGDGNSLLNRGGPPQHEPRLTRVPSLPPTREVDEEQPLRSPPTAPKPPIESKYSPRQTRHTPPPVTSPPYNITSPSKRSVSSYIPMSPAAAPHKEVNFAPPPRSQTQSPGALHRNQVTGRHADPVPRPSSVQGATSPRESIQNVDATRSARARGVSQHLNLVPPTDGRELDPLQRWRGAPVTAWGVGGILVSSFPTNVPRYGISQALPMIVRSPGEVKIKHVKDVYPLEERLAKFPGPLRGKSKKKETLAWLTAGIEILEKGLPNIPFHSTASHEDKRAIERVLLWKILRVFIENDGILEGNPSVVKAVREVITPGFDSESPELGSSILTGANLSELPSAVTGIQADAVNSTAVEQIRHHLLSGDREKAVWAAVDKRLWGHAMLISNTMQGPELYKQVAQEFIKKEVNHAGHGNESLAALYGVLSGNFEESVDELVPVHARAGLQLMSTSASSGASRDALAGLDKWRETLGLVLSNRSFGDAQALRSLGNLLSGYGRAEAAHICYIFARNSATFGGLDDPNANFVLVGADHRRQADQFAKETEALQLSEVYEYALSLSASSNIAQSCPHLAAYKLQYAMTLAEYGFRDKALQYCEGIYNAITSQTKRSPYYNPVLESVVDDLMRRLKQAPKEESSSWIPKPRMDQVSNNMWSRFNKFVAGDDEDNSGNGASGEAGAESGPFARIAGGTPTISRSPSVSNFEIYGNSGPSPTAPTTKAASRYAPVGSQVSGSPYDTANAYNPAPRSSMERTSGEMSRSSYELPRRGSDMHSAYGSPYTPESNSVPTAGYQPMAPVASQTSPYLPNSQGSDSAQQGLLPSGISFTGYDPYGAAQNSPYSGTSQLGGSLVTDSKPDVAVNDTNSTQGYQPPSYGYEPPSTNTEEPTKQSEGFSGGYEPPSYQPSSFEPPSYEPGPADDEEDSPTGSKPKKKSFFDDDEDDIPSVKPREKSKAERDRENEEMVRKVAEEEAKRAAEAKAFKKGWGFGGWFGGGGKKESADLSNPNKPIKAKLGEASTFVYDPELKRWVNKKPGAENTPAKAATPPPPRAASGLGTPPPHGPTSAPAGGLNTPPAGPPMGPPTGPPRTQLSPSPALLSHADSEESLSVPSAPPMMRSASNQSTVSAAVGPPSAPPSRPATSLSNASSIDDLLGAAGPRKGGKKARKSGRYIDVMAK
ncbi:Sec23-binding domain of Sec16-domain-containing protein [Durotheca rogersii]|uniref:Sec23-binding domain of Sec16-domain-containing protein n=1 Tax=Durotheca rogersii TaxID=419775 RepID=UPI00221F5484|nr:Sec23-binding domain of Sec16-domain-containing protein [Durotheca rogersii]KAI5867280.1 Sec23-binding domain of Sec16-domain-containing protein [Durotheca rogersii]